MLIKCDMCPTKCLCDCALSNILPTNCHLKIGGSTTFKKVQGISKTIFKKLETGLCTACVEIQFNYVFSSKCYGRAGWKWNWEGSIVFRVDCTHHNIECKSNTG